MNLDDTNPDHAELRSLRMRNGTKLQQLAISGMQVGGLTENRREILIDLILGTDTPERLAFELAYERQVAEALAEAEKARREAMLTAPSPMPKQPGLTVMNGRGHS